MYDYENEFSIRPEDFRKSWPHALSIVTREFFEAVRVLETVEQKVESLAGTTPVMMGVAQDHVMNSSRLAVDAIEAAIKQFNQSHREQMRQINQSLVDISAARDDLLKFLTAQRMAAEAAFSNAKKRDIEVKSQLSKLHMEKEKLHTEKLEFKSLGIFKRIFYKA